MARELSSRPAPLRALPGSGEGSPTMASALTEAIRTDIIRGWLKPGQRLKIQELAERYEAGTIPVREALSRLATSGFVEAKDQRGFFVCTVSAEELSDLHRVRLLVEPVALRDSIENGDGAWEERVLSAHHRMSRLIIYIAQPGGELNPEWEAAHDDFHRQLLSACTSPWLLRFADTLRAQTARYRHITVASSRTPKRDVPSEHKAILDAALERRTDVAVALITEHLNLTTNIALEARHTLQATTLSGK